MNDKHLEVVIASLKEAQEGLNALLSNQETLLKIVAAGEILAETVRRKKKILSCGNGGSMCDAMHFAEELTGRFRENRPAIAAMAISDPGHLTCVANDFGYEQVFGKFIEAHGQPGDVLMAISTSGSSKNVIIAAEAARRAGMKVIGLTGKHSAVLSTHCDIHIATPAGKWADRVQELHIKVLHNLVDLVEKSI